MWHQTHIPTDKTIYNQLTNKLKAKLKEMRDEWEPPTKQFYPKCNLRESCHLVNQRGA
jgi:hypothetical protein